MSTNKDSQFTSTRIIKVRGRKVLVLVKKLSNLKVSLLNVETKDRQS